MNPFDIILALFILGGAYQGYKDGFIVSLCALFAIVLGVSGGFKLMGWAIIFLTDYVNIDKKMLPYVAFAFVFLIILACVNLVGKLIKTLAKKPLLGQFDQLTGAVIGLVKVTFMLSIVLWFTDSLKLNFPEDWTTHSWLHPTIAGFAPTIANGMNEFLPF